ncbi:hypothetical protein BDN67DRAFT_1014506 [Paxillus ammoniavirescens]|nr:hypothetical protein BDN67DRAFT_1014506 [Paxillus ammoniavirescens]
MDAPQPHRRRPTQCPLTNAHAGPKRVNISALCDKCQNDRGVNLDIPGPLVCNAHTGIRGDRGNREGDWGQQRKASTTSHGTMSVGAARAAMSDIPAAAPGDALTVILLSPLFTPVSLHSTLGYTYTGTVFSHHTCDLETASTYLSLPQLYDDETQVHAVYEMLHGLYHAFLEFKEYERITGANWGTGQCHCRQYAHRVPCVLEYALADDIVNKYLDRSIVGHC